MTIKKIHPLYLVPLFLLLTLLTCAQTDSLNAPYLKFNHIPEFIISKSPDSTIFTNKNLKKDVHTIFIVFSPDCEFCQHETRDLLKNIKRFKKTQIIMVSFKPQAMINEFYKKYKLGNYPMITIGKDSKYFFFKFFRLRIAPSTFVYDRKGNFKKAFHQIVDMETLLKEIE